MENLVCARLCRYYKPQRQEEERCQGYTWLAQRPELTGSLNSLDPAGAGPLFGLSPQDPRLLAICQECPFLIDGCDFRDPQVPDDQCAPCGGLRAIAGLLAAGCEI